MTRTLRVIAVGLLVAIAAAIVIAAAPPQPVRAGSALVYPDLISDPPDGQTLSTETINGSSGLLLRFNGYVHNAAGQAAPDLTQLDPSGPYGPGPGALELHAAGSMPAPGTPTAMTSVFQRVYSTNIDPSTRTYAYTDIPLANANVYFEAADGHNHFHLRDVARYSLWNDTRTTEVAPSAKVGFCPGDWGPRGQEPKDGGPGPGDTYGDPWYTSDKVNYPKSSPAYNDCDRNHPDYTSVMEGISYGWVDNYTSDLWFQWVDVSDVAPGTYWLRSDIDPKHVFLEGPNGQRPANSAVPAWSTTASVIPGYVAQPVVPGTVPYGATKAIPLSSTIYGSPGARTFTIASAPAHGTLSVAPGTPFAGPTVSYTPKPGYAGPDSFAYSASDSTSAFPRHPPTATVALNVGQPGPSVAVSGPSYVQVATDAQYAARVSSDAPGVTWRIAGAGAGSPRVGTIGSTGLYRAPRRVPSPSVVTIVARSRGGAVGQESVLIGRTPPPTPGPMPRVRAPRRGRLLGLIAVGRVGRLLVAGVMAARRGTLRIDEALGGRAFGHCQARSPGRRAFVCRLRMPARANLRRVAVFATLRIGRRVVARASFRGVPARLSSR